MATKESALTGLEPRSFWGHFEALTTIARPSRQEEPVIEHVRAWAAGHGLDVRQDAGRNLVIPVPATPGRESAPTLILQGHLDMVCERDPSSPNDPAEGRIVLVRDGDWLSADGTTLGADDGVAIAAMMALVEDESLAHGPLELLDDRRRGGGARGRERARRVAADRVHSHQPRQRGGWGADRRLCGQHRHVDQDRRSAVRTGSRGGDARRDRPRRTGRAFGNGDRDRQVECDQGPRARAPRGARGGAVQARLARRRQEPERDPA